PMSTDRPGYFPPALGVDLGVNLGRADMGMAQHDLRGLGAELLPHGGRMRVAELGRRPSRDAGPIAALVDGALQSALGDLEYPAGPGLDDPRGEDRDGLRAQVDRPRAVAMGGLVLDRLVEPASRLGPVDLLDRHPDTLARP